MRYKHILAALDTTDDATHVLEAAQQMAKDHNALLSIATVVKPLLQVYGGLEMNSVSTIEQQAYEYATTKMKAHGEQVKLEKDHVYVMRGSPANEIRSLSHELHADLIVIGTHGRHGMGLMLLGSTANGVIHGTQCDVLAVRIHDTE
ncbi:MAG: universal stress protein [Pseudomonadales bacterium]|nr:universal stress protein [Pseudomonadales bacterium]